MRWSGASAHSVQEEAGAFGSLKKEKAKGECDGFSCLEKVLEKIEPNSTRNTRKRSPAL